MPIGLPTLTGNQLAVMLLPSQGEPTVAWSSKKQATVALSTAESEYISATHAAKQVKGVPGFQKRHGVDIFS